MRESVARAGGWRVAHAFGTPVPGWLVVVPTRHVTSLGELSDSEAAYLGPLLRNVTRALPQVVGCEKTYVALFAEAEGFAHVHFHVIPRMPDQAGEFRGPRVFQLLGASEADRVTDTDMDALSSQLTSALQATAKK
jgi:diadenosine tetraphosphate (Ap4A) HIT family hydrolase